jgi:sec-independent protein translocase protein TatA
MGEFGPWHWIIVAAVFVLLFGYKKLPDAARSLGKSARILKTELKDLHHDDDQDDASKQIAQLQATAAPTPVVPAAPVVPVAVPTEAQPQPVASGDQTPAQ